MRYLTRSLGIFLLIHLIYSCNKDELPTLTTSFITNITETSATSGGTIISGGSGPIIARGVCWSTLPDPTVNSTSTSDGTGPGTFTSILTDLKLNTLYYARAYATNSMGTSYGNELRFTTRGVSGTVTDIELNSYITIEIGTQIWMAENLKTTKFSDGTIIPVISDGMAWAALTTPGCCWYNNDEDKYKEFYGALYNWYSVNYITNGGKNICPAGWHVPGNDEWTIFENYLITNGYNYDGTISGNKIAKSLAATSGWAEDGGPGTVGNEEEKNNNSGFTALPAGLSFYSGDYTFAGNIGGWWSTSESSGTDAYSRFLDSSSRSLEKGENMKIDGFSVRCIKDK